MSTYVVVEGKFEAALLERLLGPSRVPDARVLVGGRRTQAISTARSLLVSRHVPVAVFADAGAFDPGAVFDQELSYFELLQIVSPGVPFRVFLAVPEVETVFFAAPEALGRIVGRPISIDELREAEFRPRAVLQRLISEAHPGADRSSIVERIDPEAACAFSRHPLVRSLVQFLRHPQAWAPEAVAA